MKLEFWFEFGSTYSYPAAMEIEEAIRGKNVELVWKPFLLGPIFKAQGWNDSPFNIYPAKGQYMWRDMQRICLALNIPFSKPSVFPRNGLLAARIACRYSDASWISEFVRNVYTSNFAKDLDISDSDVLLSCIPLSFSKSVLIIEEANSIESKNLLRKNTDDAISLGIFGAPSFVVGSELFWGSDRLEAAIEWASKA